MAMNNISTLIRILLLLLIQLFVFDNSNIVFASKEISTEIEKVNCVNCIDYVNPNNSSSNCTSLTNSITQNALIIEKVRRDFIDKVIDYHFNYCLKNKTCSTPYHQAVLAKNAVKKILFLGDMERPDKNKKNPWESGAKLLQKKFFGEKRGVKLYQTDYDIKGKIVSKNLISQHIDHNKKFPFKKGETFDAIVMKRGMCHCDRKNPKITCGGVDCSLNCSDSKSAQSFIDRVIKVLNIKNKSSFAVLHGPFGNNNSECYNFWSSLSQQISHKNKDISVNVVTDNDGDFYAILITPST
ncbi:MAG: hypothetical protein HQK49_18835 [Oligoflexia bacterium]|nr:hypothetical protein [Oligoflexia bacterium]